MKTSYLVKSTQAVFVIMFILRGYYTPNLKLACFVLYLKIINTFLKNNK